MKQKLSATKVSKRFSILVNDVLNVAIGSISVPLDESYSLQIIQLLQGPIRWPPMSLGYAEVLTHESSSGS